MKHIVVTIRYSILMENNLRKSWKVGLDNDFESYKKILFDSSRLSVREKIFNKICLPSLIKINNSITSDISFKVHILTSSLLPLENKRFLKEISTHNTFIEIKEHDPETANLHIDFQQYLDENFKEGDIYASVRLDDDDALSIEWLNEITKFINPNFNDFVISLSSGHAAVINNDIEIDKIMPYKWKGGSAGLTYIGMNKKAKTIYQCGPHLSTDDKFKTIIYSNGNFFFRTFNEFNDSDTHTYIPKTEPLNDLDKSKILDFYL